MTNDAKNVYINNIESQGEEARPNRELTSQRKTQPEQGGARKDGAVKNPFYALVEQKGLFKKGFTPAGEDPAFWPIPLLNEINYYIVNKEYLTNSSGPGIWGVPPAEIAERYAPMKETIRKVKTAYEIIAYPHCKDWGRRDNIEAELERDQQSFDRRSVELNEEELGMLKKLAAARGLPCDSEKRVYEYSDVLKASPSEKPQLPQK